MEYILPGFFLLLLGLVLLLNLLPLPANWIMVALVFVWRFANPNPGAMDMVYFLSVIGLAALGEVIELVAQAWGAKKYGSTNSGMLGGIIGAITGAILGVPFLFGLGALFGALTGAWMGPICLNACADGQRRKPGRPPRVLWSAGFSASPSSVASA